MPPLGAPSGLPPHGPTTSISRVAPDHLWFFVYRDVNKQFRWRLVAGNNKKIANSGEGYRNKADCIAAINLVAASDQRPIVYARNAQ